MAEPAPKCFTCGNDLIGDKSRNWDKFYDLYDTELENEKKKGADIEDDCVKLYVSEKILDKLKYNRICCRRMFLGDTRELREILRLYLNRD